MTAPTSTNAALTDTTHPAAATVGSVLRAATHTLAATSSTPHLDATLLLAHVLGMRRSALLARGEQPLTAAQHADYTALLARRATGEPIAYLTGQREFYGLQLRVTPAVLVPRPETELLVEHALAHARAMLAHGITPCIADIGTGSGAIALALAANLPPAVTLYATDIVPAALAVAHANAAHLGLTGRVQFLAGDLLAPLPHPIDLLVSNPPYTMLSTIDPAVRAHEPHLALDGGSDGLAVCRRLLATAPSALNKRHPRHAILLEIGATQGAALRVLAHQHCPGYAVRIAHDLAQHDRVVTITPATNPLLQPATSPAD